MSTSAFEMEKCGVSEERAKKRGIIVQPYPDRVTLLLGRLGSLDVPFLSNLVARSRV